MLGFVAWFLLLFLPHELGVAVWYLVEKASAILPGVAKRVSGYWTLRSSDELEGALRAFTKPVCATRIGLAPGSRGGAGGEPQLAVCSTVEDEAENWELEERRKREDLKI